MGQCTKWIVISEIYFYQHKIHPQILLRKKNKSFGFYETFFHWKRMEISDKN